MGGTASVPSDSSFLAPLTRRKMGRHRGRPSLKNRMLLDGFLDRRGSQDGGESNRMHSHAQAPNEALIRDTFSRAASGPDNLANLSPDRLVLQVCRMNGNSKYRRITHCNRQGSVPIKTRHDTPRRARAPDQRTRFDLAYPAPFTNRRKKPTLCLPPF